MSNRKNPFHKFTGSNLGASRVDPVLVSVVRGNKVESKHRVHACVIKDAANITHYWGNVDCSFFPRSTVKIIQTLPWMIRGLDKKFTLTTKHLAIACASHHGQAEHVELVKKWLAEQGLTESDLECGAHMPYSTKGIVEAVKTCGGFTALHNNCSGKHTAMLMACRDMQLPMLGYTDFDHPYQQEVKKYLELFVGRELKDWGIDGCGIPTFLLSLKELARVASLVANPNTLDSHIQEAILKLNSAIRQEPIYFGGADSFCTRVIEATQGRVFAKIGAEGVYIAWIPEANIGIAMKCEDGAARAVEVALAVVLRNLGFDLTGLHNIFSLKRWAGEAVGEYYCE